MKRILSLLILLPTLAFAWTPTELISVTIGYTGSQNELAFRKAMEVVIKNNPAVTFVPTNRPGGDGVVSNNFLVTQPANGYHIGLPSIAPTVVTNDLWQKDIKKYSWEECPIPVVLGETHLAIVAANSSPVNSFQELVALLKNPNRDINIASSGGSLGIAYKELIRLTNSTSNRITDIPFPATPANALAVAGGQVEFGINSYGAVAALAKDQRLKVLALISNESVRGYPLARDTLPGFQVTNGIMIMLPPATPRDIVQWYETEFGRAIRSPEYQQWAADNNMTINTNLTTDKNVKEYLKSVKVKLSKVVRFIEDSK